LEGAGVVFCIGGVRRFKKCRSSKKRSGALCEVIASANAAGT
jgi:hypothetical protein